MENGEAYAYGKVNPDMGGGRDLLYESGFHNLARLANKQGIAGIIIGAEGFTIGFLIDRAPGPPTSGTGGGGDRGTWNYIPDHPIPGDWNQQFLVEIFADEDRTPVISKILKVDFDKINPGEQKYLHLKMNVECETMAFRVTHESGAYVEINYFGIDPKI